MTGTQARLAAAALAAAAFTTPASAQKTTAEYASGATRPKSVALLPVEATVTRARAVEIEGLVDDGVQLGAQFNARLSSLMVAKGYEVLVVGAEQIDADPKLQEYVVEASRNFRETMSKCRPKNVPKHLCKVGDSVQVLADRLHVDALVFSNLQITITPAGRAVLTALIGGVGPGASSSLEIVDGRTGELEALFFAAAMVGPGDKTDVDIRGYAATLAEKTTNKMPSSDPSARMDTGKNDDQAVDEVEQLLKQ